MFMKCGYNYLVMEINNIINNKLDKNELTSNNNQFKGKVNDKFKTNKGEIFNNKKNPPKKPKKNIFQENLIIIKTKVQK